MNPISGNSGTAPASGVRYPGLEVIKLKIKRNDWLLADNVIVLCFELENELKFYNVEARYRSEGSSIHTHFVGAW